MQDEAKHDWLNIILVDWLHGSFDGRPLVTKMENKYPFTYDTLAHLLLELLHCRFIVVCKLQSPQDYEVVGLGFFLVFLTDFTHY